MPGFKKLPGRILRKATLILHAKLANYVIFLTFSQLQSKFFSTELTLVLFDITIISPFFKGKS